MPVSTWVLDQTTTAQMRDDFNAIPAAYTADVSSYSKTLAAVVNWDQGVALDLFSATMLQETNRSASTPVALAQGNTSAYMPTIPSGQNYIIFPTPPARPAAMNIMLRIQFGIVKGSLQSALVQLRRKADDSLVTEAVVRRDPDTDAQLVVLPTFIYGANDPFVTGGFRVVLNNTSGSNMQISTTTVVRFAVQWTHMGLPI